MATMDETTTKDKTGVTGESQDPPAEKGDKGSESLSKDQVRGAQCRSPYETCEGKIEEKKAQQLLKRRKDTLEPLSTTEEWECIPGSDTVTSH